MKKRTIKHITNYSWSYYFASIYVDLMHRLFYKKIVVEGKENVPKDGKVIFAPNHQNALMDPLAVIFTMHYQIVFLARGDIFSLPIVPGFFRWLKILPIFRIRNGISSLKNNEDSFDAAIQVLENGHYIGLFPEAQHNNKRQLLSFKKGIPRIAFQAEEQNDFKLGVQIVPVGIYYSKYNYFRSVLTVRYGKPIPVANYVEEYKQNANKAMLSLKEDMRKATSPLVVDIQNKEHYSLYENIRRLYADKMSERLGEKLTEENRLFADKKTVNLLDNLFDNDSKTFDSIVEKNDKYQKIKAKHNLCTKAIGKPRTNIVWLLLNFIGLIAFSPIMIYTLCNNLLSYVLPKYLVGKIKDIQFHSSVKFLWALFLLPIFYIVQTIIVWSISDDWKVAVAYFISLILFGMWAQYWVEWLTYTRNHFKLWKLKLSNKTDYQNLYNSRKEVMGVLDSTDI